MPNELLLASAGAGKTTRIVQDALQSVRNGQSVLILTYTRNNQYEIIKKIRALNGSVPKGIAVKGWFSFLLEDMIRPYQRCFFAERVANIAFDQSDPHKKGRRTIPGRAERLNNAVNRRHYLIGNKVHTTYISKLASNICNAGKTGRGALSSYLTIDRLASIYDVIIIDEVQDLVGWDYSLLNYILSRSDIQVRCVGDFRQTIYETSNAKKSPLTSEQKREWFTDKGFNCQQLNYSWRCVDPICTFADIVHSHQNYEQTQSNVVNIPIEFDNHVGVFAVSKKNVSAYLDRYQPTILRYNKSVQNDMCKGSSTQNFGESKGQSFNRVLIIPTDNYAKFLQNNMAPIRNAKTEEALNKLYVAITRARYSVAFLYDDIPKILGINVWTP